MNPVSPVDAPFAEGMEWLRIRDHLPQAEAAFRAGLAADPDHPGCLLHLGVTLRNLGRLKEADGMLQRVLQLTPEDPVVHMQIGTLRRWQKRMDEALSAYDAALALDPGHVNTRIARAIALQEMRRWPEALETYDRLIAELPPDVAASTVLPRRRKEVADVMDRIRACGADPADSHQRIAVALYRCANQRVLAGDLPEAVGLYEDAALLEPDYADPAFPLGATVETQMARRPKGEYPSCVWIEECLYLHPTWLGFCCTSHPGGRSSPVVGSYQGGPVPIDYVLARRDLLRQENACGVDNACRTCHEFGTRTWPAPTHPVGILIISNHTVCSQKCSYCTLAQANFEMPGYYYMAEPVVASLLDRGWMAPDAFIIWGGGEPTVSREFPAIAARLRAAGCRLNVYTNATRSMPVLVDALLEGNAETVTSVDSGTPETFYRIRYMSDAPVTLVGRPAFEVVWDNIATYAQASPDGAIVKYVFTLGNITEADLSGFVAHCADRGVRRILLALEVDDMLGGQVPGPIWDAIDHTRVLAQGKGLTVYYNPPFFRLGNLPERLRAAFPATHEGIVARVGWDAAGPLAGHDRYLSIVGIAVARNPEGEDHA